MYPKISFCETKTQDCQDSHTLHWMSPESILTKCCLDKSRIDMLTQILTELNYLIMTHHLELLDGWDTSVQLVKSKYNMSIGDSCGAVIKNFDETNSSYVYVGSYVKTLDTIPDHPVSFIVDTFIDELTKEQFELCPSPLPLLDNDFYVDGLHGHIPYEKIFKNLRN